MVVVVMLWAAIAVSVAIFLVSIGRPGARRRPCSAWSRRPASR
jgi:hypothetical protein